MTDSRDPSRRFGIGRAAVVLAFAASAVAAAAPGSSREPIDPGSELAGLRSGEPSPALLELASTAADRYLAAHRVAHPELLTIIDYSLPSTEPRIWVIDREARRVLHHGLVAHGRGSGENFAVEFSNREGSLQSSLGLFLTEETYVGRNGYSLRLEGLEPGINDRARERTIVMHGAWYVTPGFAREHGRIGRSWGCPALEPEAARTVIDTIRDGSLLFVYAPEPGWLASSRFLGGGAPGIAAAP